MWKACCAVGSESCSWWAIEAARAGVEMALWDLQGKALGRPLYDLIGGRTRDGLVEVIAWGWDEPDELAAKTRAARDLGITVFKIKVGDAPKETSERVAAVRDAAGPEARITVDANQGWWDAGQRSARPSNGWSRTASSSRSSRCAWATSKRRASCANAWTYRSRSTRVCAGRARRWRLCAPGRATSSSSS